MLSVSEAREIVLRHAQRGPIVRKALNRAAGCVLAEPVVASDDSPPFDKSIVDGYAVRASDLGGNPPFELAVVEEIDAGRAPTRRIGAGECALVMTGAPLPPGADAVVMIEQADRLDARRVQIRTTASARQNRIDRGTEYRAGEVLVPALTRLSPAYLGVMASAGFDRVDVFAPPTACVVTTGDEVVPAGDRIGPAQIRNSNGPLLQALLKRLGASRCPTLHIGDEQDALRDKFRRLLQPGRHEPAPDFLVVAGGVSAGRRDFVPAALRDAGASLVFHKVALRPGKPFWFGTGPPRESAPPVLVFGLPGNPVSGLACSLLFIQPAIDLYRGLQPAPLISRAAKLTATFQHRGERATFFPARIVVEEPFTIETLTWGGSSDLRTVASADGFAVFEPGEATYPAGSTVGFLRFRTP